MRNKYYVYEWYNVETNEVFYVGKGNGDRYKNLSRRSIRFREYYSTHDCSVRKVHENLSEEDAFKQEKLLIRYYRESTNFPLTNVTDGGDGGIVPTKDFIEKMRTISMGENNPNYGNKWTEEQKREASKRAKEFHYEGENNPNYGNKWNDEQRLALSKIRRGNPLYVGENHGRAKQWIILETGDIRTCKKNIKERISELEKIPFGYHFEELTDELLNEDFRLRKLLNILSEIKSFDIYIKYDKTIFYGKKNLVKDLPFGEKKLNTLLKENKNIIKTENNTYYEIKHSPFI